MENSPPGIQTIPLGAGRGAGALFATVGAKAAPETEGGFDPACMADESIWKALTESSAETNKGAKPRIPGRARDLRGRGASADLASPRVDFLFLRLPPYTRRSFLRCIMLRQGGCAVRLVARIVKTNNTADLDREREAGRQASTRRLARA